MPCWHCGAGTGIRQVLFDGRPTQDFGNRVLQPNAIAHALALVILLALLLMRLFGAQLLRLVSQAFAVLGMGRSSKYKLTNLPSLAIAVRSRLLIGPGSYSMEKHEKYAAVFAAASPNGSKAAHSRSKASKEAAKQAKTKQVGGLVVYMSSITAMSRMVQRVHHRGHNVRLSQATLAA